MTHPLPLALGLLALALLGCPTSVQAEDGATPPAEQLETPPPKLEDAYAQMDPADRQRLEEERLRFRNMRIAGGTLLVLGALIPPITYAALSAGEDCEADGDLCGLDTAVGTLAALVAGVPTAIGGAVTLAIGIRRGRALELRPPVVAASHNGVRILLGGRF